MLGRQCRRILFVVLTAALASPLLLAAQTPPTTPLSVPYAWKSVGDGRGRGGRRLCRQQKRRSKRCVSAQQRTGIVFPA